MTSADSQHLPSVDTFGGLSHEKQRQHLQDALSRFLDRLQAEGREPDLHETQYFRSATEALGEGNYDQAYEDAKALQNLPPVVEDEIGISGQPLSRSETATGLRSLIDRLQQ